MDSSDVFEVSWQQVVPQTSVNNERIIRFFTYENLNVKFVSNEYIAFYQIHFAKKICNGQSKAVC